MADSNQFSRSLTPEFLLEVAKGSVSKHQYLTIGLHNPSIGTTEESLHPYGGLQNYSTSAVEIFISSSSASDTAKIITVTGLNSDLLLETRAVVANGQTAVSAGTWFRVIQLRNLGGVAGGGSLVGTLYAAEADTLVAGVPSTPSKVRCVIAIATGTTRSYNEGITAGFTPPVGTFAIIRTIRFAAPKGQDVTFSTMIRPNNDDGTIIRPFQDVAPFNLYQATVDLEFDGIFVDQLWDFEIRARTSSGSAVDCTAIVSFILIERDN